MFQSPCGEVVWESKNSLGANWEEDVSIPLRGSRLGKSFTLFAYDFGNVSFNPLAGKSFGKGKKEPPSSDIFFKFQSPCGEVVWERQK